MGCSFMPNTIKQASTLSKLLSCTSRSPQLSSETALKCSTVHRINNASFTQQTYYTMGICQSKDDMATTSKLLTLPGEIRNLILEYCFSESGVVCYHKKCKLGKYRRSTRVGVDVSAFHVRRVGAIAHHILGTCRQLRAEALPIYLQQAKFIYALSLPAITRHQKAVLDFLCRTQLDQVRKLAFPGYRCDEDLINAFPNLSVVEFGVAEWMNQECGLFVEQHKAPWSVLELVNAAKSCLEDCVRADSSGDSSREMTFRIMHMLRLVEMPDRQFRITCFVMMTLPVVDHKGKEKCIMVNLRFDWDSGKLLREPTTKAAGGLGRVLQYSEDDML